MLKGCFLISVVTDCVTPPRSVGFAAMELSASITDTPSFIFVPIRGAIADREKNRKSLVSGGVSGGGGGRGIGGSKSGGGGGSKMVSADSKMVSADSKMVSADSKMVSADSNDLDCI